MPFYNIHDIVGSVRMNTDHPNAIHERRWKKTKNSQKINHTISRKFTEIRSDIINIMKVNFDLLPIGVSHSNYVIFMMV